MVSGEEIQHAVECIQEKMEFAQPGCIGMVMGSGLGGALQGLTIDWELPYEDIDGFPCSSVEGHEGKLVAGTLAGRPVLAMSGRVHLYEGFDAATTCIPVRVLAGLGVKTLILTNSAGSLNYAFQAGSLMLVDDHINFTGQSPLTGPNNDNWGPRFPDCSRLYSPRLRDQLARTARSMEYELNRGVYIQVAGPQYETPAETRAFRLLGADAIGMSTALEALAASHMSMEVMAISCLTNLNIAQYMAPTSHEDVINTATKTAKDLARLLEAVIPDI